MNDYEDDIKIYVPGSSSTSDKPEANEPESDEVRLYPSA